MQESRIGLSGKLRLALIALLVLSLVPLPLRLDQVRAAEPELNRQPPEPPAKAVAFLESQRHNDNSPQSSKKNAQQRKQSKQQSAASKRKARGQAKRVNAQGCVFQVNGTTWTLVRTCQPEDTIAIPDGITLNGDNKALIVTGNASRFHGAVVASGFGWANVENLRIVGKAGLRGSCRDLSVGLLFYESSGQIRNVTIRKLDLGNQLCRSSGIAAFSGSVKIVGSTVDRGGASAITVARAHKSTVIGNDLRVGGSAGAFGPTGLDIFSANTMVVRDNDFQSTQDLTGGIFATSSLKLKIAGNRFRGLAVGINLSGFTAGALIRGNRMTDIDIAGMIVSQAPVRILRNTIQGVNPALGVTGLSLGPGSQGVASNNRITSFDCGITNSGSTVILGANNLAGNTQPVCP